jgi:hypothetical protein
MVLQRFREPRCNIFPKGSRRKGWCTVMTTSEDRIGAEARGKLRLWKTAAEQRWAALDRLQSQLQSVAVDFVKRTSLPGRRRVFARVDQQVRSQGAVLWDVRLSGPTPLALWAILKPREPVLLTPTEPGETQDCVTIDYLVFGAVLGPHSAGRADGLWSLEVSDHALLRLLQRLPGADLTATLFAAHHSSLALSARALAPHLGQPKTFANSFLLDTGSGAFICGVAIIEEVTTGPSLYIRARTWLHHDQFSDHQISLPSGRPGDRLGEGMLLPAPFRRLVKEDSGLRVYTRPWAESLGLPQGTA